MKYHSLAQPYFFEHISVYFMVSWCQALEQGHSRCVLHEHVQYGSVHPGSSGLRVLKQIARRKWPMLRRAGFGAT